MRRTKSGKRNKQDWDIKDHLAAGHSPVAPPLPGRERRRLGDGVCRNCQRHLEIRPLRTPEPIYGAMGGYIMEPEL